MQDVLYLITATGFLLWIGRNTIYWVFQLQKRSYSRKVLRHHVIRQFQSPVALLEWGTILFYPFVIFQERYLFTYHLFICGIYLTKCFFILKELVKTNIFSKTFTIPSFILLLGTLFIVVLLFLFPPLDKYLWLLLLDRFLILFIVILVILSIIPGEFYQEYIESLLQKKLKKENRISIVCIGGIESTIQKNLLYQVLSKKYSVLKTPPMSKKDDTIHTLKQKLEPQHEFVLVDLVERTKDDLETIIEILSPKYLVINTLEPFYENSAPIESIKYKQLKRIYSNKEKIESKLKSNRIRYFSSASIHDQKVKKDSVSFRVTVNNIAIKITSDIPISTFSSSYIPVVEILLEEGYDPATISRVLKTTTGEENIAHLNRMGDITIINNSGDTKPENVVHFHDYVQLFRKNKILVLDADWDIHEPSPNTVLRFGNTLASVYDYLFLLPSHAAKRIRKGAKQQDSGFICIDASQRIVTNLKVLIGKGDIIVFHGPRSEDVLTRFDQVCSMEKEGV